MDLDNRILLGGVAVVIIAIIAVFALLPSSGIMKTFVPNSANVPSSLTAVSTQIKPILILYNGSSVLNSTERDATVKSNFYVANPNTTTVILESITYQLTANGVVVGHGQIGQRYEGSWESSYYFPLLAGTSSNIGDSAFLKNTGNYPSVWAAMQKGQAKFEVSGTAYYATKTAFSGSDYTEDFNFTS